MTQTFAHCYALLIGVGQCEERRMSQALTDYLWRGFTEPEPTFENPEKEK